MSISRKYYGSLIVLSFFFIVIVIVFIVNYRDNQEIENNSVETIALVTDATMRRSVQSIDYKYIYNDKEIKAVDTEADGDLKKYVGRFFIVKLSSKNPTLSKIYLNSEIRDTLRIIKAGFLMNQKK